MRIDTGYNYHLLIYVFVIFIYLFLFLFLTLELGLSSTIFQICINPSTTSRIAFKHHLVKQIHYCLSSVKSYCACDVIYGSIKVMAPTLKSRPRLNI